MMYAFFIIPIVISDKNSLIFVLFVITSVLPFVRTGNLLDFEAKCDPEHTHCFY
jgi:hypothetical protein